MRLGRLLSCLTLSELEPPKCTGPRRLVFSKITALFGRRLRYLISGGAPLPVEINRFFAATGLPIVEGYGLTEAAPVVSCNLHGQTRIGTVGRALKDIEVRTAEDGELLVRGPNVMRGYYGREVDTAEAIDFTIEDDCQRRCGLTLRYCPADVTAGLGWNAKGVVVSGVDPSGHWANAPRPATD